MCYILQIITVFNSKINEELSSFLSKNIDEYKFVIHKAL